MPQRVEGVGIFVPTIVEGATVSELRVSFFEGEELILQTFVGIEEVLKGDEERYEETNLQGYSFAYLYADTTKLESIHLIASYKFPPTENGGITMCGPTRRFKLVELIK